MELAAGGGVRIGLIGTEGSHAPALVDWFRGPGRGRGEITVATGGPALEGVATVASPAELIGHVDAICVMDRDARRHREQAVPLLAAGLPVWLDKPLATTVEDAEAILAAAREGGVPVSSFSAMRWASEIEDLKAHDVGTAFTSGPVQRDSPHGGIAFYAIHPIEMALELVGGRVTSITAEATHEHAVVLARAGQGIIAVRFVEGEAPYQVEAVTQHGVESRTLTLGERYFDACAERIAAMFETGRAPLTDEDLTGPVMILEALLQAVVALL